MAILIKPSDVKFVKRLFVQAQAADPAPPLGTVLGNLGVNTVNFCTNFNLYTKNLPMYFKVKVIIFIYDNRSTTFSIQLPSIGFILNLLKFETKIKVRMFDRYHEKSIFCIKLYDLAKLAKFKFPSLNLQQSIPILLGSIKSMNLVIVK